MLKAVGLLAVLAALAVAEPAQAHSPTPFKIADDINFATGVATFTATGALCRSGTFTDDEVIFLREDETSADLKIDSTYTCADGSGTFNAIKYLHLTFTAIGFRHVGIVRLTGGTRAYKRLKGAGVTTGGTVGDVGAGTTIGVVR